MKELIEAYDEYIELLSSSERSLIGLAYSHGFRFPEAKVKRGAELRAQISDLKSRLGANFAAGMPRNADAPEIEITPEMIAAGVQTYYENAGAEWDNPGLDELKIMLREVYSAMAKSALPMPSTGGAGRR